LEEKTMDKQKSSKIRLISLVILIICNVLLPANPASSAAIQKIYYTIAGDCVDYYDENDEYAFFEDEPDWSCYIKVKTSAPKPIRTVSLQYWNSRKWVQESVAKTSTKGIAYLNFDPYCDGSYCDGEWKYRVFTSASSPQKSDTSSSFYVTFYPGTPDDYEE
jgi:hypothetical protein